MNVVLRNKQLVLDSIDHFWRQRRLDDLSRYLCDDFVDHGAPPGTPVGPSGFAGSLRRILDAFPDAHNAVDDIIAEADRVVMRWTMTGTHTGDGLGFPATHRAVQFSGVTIARIAGDKIAEHWSYRDDVGLLRQLGFGEQ